MTLAMILLVHASW